MVLREERALTRSDSGGTSGCVIAGRLAEDLDAKILVLEAGPDNADLENVHMAGGWSKNFDSETDWNIITEPMDKIGNRQVKVSRGRFLGGSSGVNGTLCIRGTKQDYDDWGLDEWTGDKMFEYIKKVCPTLLPSSLALNAYGN